jgi:hypothetical protein
VSSTGALDDPDTIIAGYFVFVGDAGAGGGGLGAAGASGRGTTSNAGSADVDSSGGGIDAFSDSRRAGAAMPRYGCFLQEVHGAAEFEGTLRLGNN